MLIEARIPTRYIFSLVKKQFFIVCIIAGTLSYIDQFMVQWVEDLEYFLEHTIGISDIDMELQSPIIPMTIPSILGATITLVLAFRMNQSYDRWWEGRKIWGAIVNDSRTLIREVSLLISKDCQQPELQVQFKGAVINKLLAWNHALVGAMRNIDTSTDVLKYIKQTELIAISKFDQNLTNALLFAILEDVKKAYHTGIITEYQHIQLNKTINSLNDSMGKSERIKNTVFPHLYSKLIDDSIWCFVFILPLAYRDLNEYVEFPIVMIISMFFFLLEKLAEGLQDPFSNKPTDVPIQSIVRNIEIFALSSLGKDHQLEKTKPTHFYLM